MLSTLKPQMECQKVWSKVLAMSVKVFHFPAVNQHPNLRIFNFIPINVTSAPMWSVEVLIPETVWNSLLNLLYLKY